MRLRSVWLGAAAGLAVFGATNGGVLGVVCAPVAVYLVVLTSMQAIFEVAALVHAAKAGQLR